MIPRPNRLKLSRSQTPVSVKPPPPFPASTSPLPRTGRGRSGTAATIAVEIGPLGDGEPLWLGLLAFGRIADDLLRHQKGDLLSAFGRVQRHTWTARNGEQREQLQIIAEGIISAQAVRPGGGHKRAPTDAGNSADDPAREKGGELVDEAIPF